MVLKEREMEERLEERHRKDYKKILEERKEREDRKERDKRLELEENMKRVIDKKMNEKKEKKNMERVFSLYDSSA